MWLLSYLWLRDPQFAHLICRLTNSKIGRKLDHTQFLQFNYTDTAGTQIQNIHQKK